MQRRTKTTVAGTLILSMALLTSACSSAATTGSNTNESSSTPAATQTETASERTLKDSMGHEVKIPANPQRIIASYLEDPLVALGVTPAAQWSIKGGSVQDYLQDKLANVPTISSDLPFEAVASFTPDLLLMDSAEMVEGDKYNQYSAIAPTYVVGNAENNDWREELKTVGEVLNKSTEADKVLSDYDAKVADAKTQIQQKVGTKSAAAIWISGKSVFVVNPKLSSGDVMYNDLGFTVPDVVTQASEGKTANWSSLALESLSTLDADYLFVIIQDGAKPDDGISSSVWNSIPAVKAGHAYTLSMKSSWLYTGAVANSMIIDDILKNVVSQ
ncbi:ABC transporter substrate-binding protein [Paenibacillus sp. WLX1005]|uniref:ABC transporter substrate-binding protein n=1 Tax=Paenibacillus sp. WLX1005 TaxID=3243766 RepID=UPI003983FF19